MSLLNDVLRDLDERSAEPAAATLHLAADPPVAASNSPLDAPSGIDPFRWLGWTLVLAAGLISAWVYLQPAPEAVVFRAKETAVVAQAEVVDAATSERALSAGQFEEQSVEQSIEPSMSTDMPAVGETAVAEPFVVAADTDDADETAQVSAQKDEVTSVSEAEPVTERSSAAKDPETEPEYLALKNTDIPEPRSAVVNAPVKSHRSASVSATERVRQQIDAGELAAAEQGLRERLSAVPDDREANELLVGLLLRGGRYPAALEATDSALRYQPESEKLGLIKARLLAQGGDIDASLALLQALTADGRASRDTWQMLGALYQQQKDYAAAASVYRRLIKTTPNAGPAWVGLAIALDGQGDAAALEAYRRALALGGLPGAAERYARQRRTSLESRDG